MLKNIPKNISPELLKVLCEMGHSDEIVIADGNFPSAGINKNVIRYDACGVTDILKSILELFPLDEYVEAPVMLMKTGIEYKGKPKIWEEYEVILEKNKFQGKVLEVDRFEFYERAKTAYAVIATGETAIYANIILKKGVIK
ncbi:fucose isomerase [Cetobacterium somerae]|uniref:RbsD/FucU family protein n=1 Tax=Cetobacterium somerae TaxID=188913 RepID=UPI002259D3DC|nr:RbsD/FucU domain-containing protein [Cetobacterium somerae]MCX3066665.1 fucose isomerase [Cetobacterium somerae]